MLVSYVSIVDKIPLLEVVGLLTDTQSLDLRIWIQDKKKMAMAVLNVKKSFMQITRLRRTKMKINDLTPKQFARREIIKYLRDLFDNPAKYITNFESYTHKQQEEILRFISLDEDRINKLLNKPMGEE